MRPFTTVVSGVPRSGTSVAMQMLVAGGLPAFTDGARAADLDNPRGYYEHARVKRLRSDKAWLEQARGCAVKVIHALLPELPDDRPYRVLWMTRDLREVVRSQDAMLARSGQAVGALPPERLIAVYEAQLRHTLEWLAARPCFALLSLDYADVVRDPVAAARAIHAFLGGDLDEAAMAAAVEPQLHRNR